ncbi:tripartite tricarboxylate transporter permease [Salinarimonas rosea]|uniref:tripartite tricarboxylate transporter permease n=1 Tax=Salinarimonas rosea TaxID=552063 RepID=UPI00041E53F8|nr:tripartite tricarboxylate transporter permease [Salinarimonas rosea]
MEADIFGSAFGALVIILDPVRLAFIVGGVLLGLALGIVPGLGGMAGMALLLPFTFAMDPYTAFAVLIGMISVVNTSDTIPAVLFGVPGTSAAQATVMDGFPMARRGEAGRALSAAYASSLLGGVFGALILALLIPFLRPLMLYVGTPELLGFSIFGLSMVAVLSGSSPLRGLGVAGLGVMLAMIGLDPQTGTMRWTLGSLYLWDGLPIIPVVMGLFAIPEIADLAIRRSAIAKDARYDVRGGMLQGLRDVAANKLLVLRSGMIGAAIGAIPGLGSSVIDWLTYGHAIQTVKGAKETFGTGDVRGVIAVESANNSNTAGALVPTLAFGVPGSASMAILLAAMLVHGLNPGPSMLEENLDLTYALVWSIVVANVFGAGLCFLFSGYMARIALVRVSILFPLIVSVSFLAAYQTSRSWGDLYALMIFAVIGWTMKQLGWPRPPLILGFVLGPLVERYLFISMELYGLAWLSRPGVVTLLVLSALGFLPPLVGALARFLRGRRRLRRPSLEPSDVVSLVLIATIGAMLVVAWDWSFGARVVPLTVGLFAFAALATSLLVRSLGLAGEAAEEEGAAPRRKPMHMDLAGSAAEMPPGVLVRRAAVIGGWLVGFVAAIALFGLIPAAMLLTTGFMLVEGRERLPKTLVLAGGLGLFLTLVFDRLLAVPWTGSWLGSALPVLRAIPSM